MKNLRYIIFLPTHSEWAMLGQKLEQCMTDDIWEATSFKTLKAAKRCLRLYYSWEKNPYFEPVSILINAMPRGLCANNKKN
jgi:hypothetical protein